MKERFPGPRPIGVKFGRALLFIKMAKFEGLGKKTKGGKSKTNEELVN